jgi:hypothetical protein
MNNEIFAYNPTCTITQILSCDTLCLKIILRTGTKKQQITVPHNGEKLYRFFGGDFLSITNYEVIIQSDSNRLTYLSLTAKYIQNNPY